MKLFLKRIVLLASTAALISACDLVGGLRIINLSTPTCDATKQLKLSFNYTGQIDAMKLSFTPNGKPSQTVDIPDVTAANTNPKIMLNQSATVSVSMDLNTVATQAISSQAIAQPNPKQLYPMDIHVEARNKNGQISSLDALAVDVAGCY